MNYGNDIGYLGNNPGSISISNNVPVKHTQVYYATHRDNGARSSFMNRSFISFSFGGKWIEDFNLIACINGDRLNKQLHANFNDLVSEYEVVNGQFYWGTYYTNNQISFTLATDGITQNQLDEFKNWFAPGQVRELVLSEHPNRAIMARVSEPPVMDIIPFEEETTVMVNTTEYKTSTTVYKGEFTLNLVMDEPFWHSKSNLLAIIDSPANLITLIKRNGIITEDNASNGYRTITYTSNIDNSSRTIVFPYNSSQTQMWADIWSDANDNIVPILEDKDALKVILEDGIPTLSMLRDRMFLGNGLVFDYIEQNTRAGYAITGEAVLGNTDQAIQKIGNSITIPQNGSAYLYYAGTAPELPKIEFNISGIFQHFHSQLKKYPFIKSIKGTVLAKATNSSYGYNYIRFYTNKKEQKLYITAPLLYNDYNQAAALLYEGEEEDIRKKVNDRLTHTSLRKWVFKILDAIKKGIDINKSEALAYFITPLTGGFYNPHHFSFDPNTGKMLGTFSYRIITDDVEISSTDDFKTLGTLTTVTEDVSDMIISKPIVLLEKNSFSKDGKVEYLNSKNLSASYFISHDFETTLKDVSITYQNKYY